MFSRQREPDVPALAPLSTPRSIISQIHYSFPSLTPLLSNPSLSPSLVCTRARSPLPSDFASSAKALLTSLALSAALLTAPSPALAAPALSPSDPIYDGANALTTGSEERLRRELIQLGEDTPWKLRVLTKFADAAGPTGDEVRKAWGVDRDTVVVIADPSAPYVPRFERKLILFVASIASTSILGDVLLIYTHVLV